MRFLVLPPISPRCQGMTTVEIDHHPHESGNLCPYTYFAFVGLLTNKIVLGRNCIAIAFFGAFTQKVGMRFLVLPPTNPRCQGMTTVEIDRHSRESGNLCPYTYFAFVGILTNKIVLGRNCIAIAFFVAFTQKVGMRFLVLPPISPRCQGMTTVEIDRHSRESGNLCPYTYFAFVGLLTNKIVLGRNCIAIAFFVAFNQKVGMRFLVLPPISPRCQGMTTVEIDHHPHESGNLCPYTYFAFVGLLTNKIVLGRNCIAIAFFVAFNQKFGMRFLVLPPTNPRCQGMTNVEIDRHSRESGNLCPYTYFAFVGLLTNKIVLGRNCIAIAFFVAFNQKFGMRFLVLPPTNPRCQGMTNVEIDRHSRESGNLCPYTYFAFVGLLTNKIVLGRNCIAIVFFVAFTQKVGMRFLVLPPTSTRCQE
jgi:hypothetical protein